MHNFIYMAGLFSWLGDNIKEGVATFFYTVLLWLNCIIYSFISFVYQIFLILANGGKIFDDSLLSDMVSRLYVVIGVIVLFLVAYSLLKNMIDPDKATKDKKGPVSIIKDVLISIVLIAIVPYIFQFAFDFQNSLLINNTVGKLIVGTPTDDDANNIRDGGYIMAATVWQAFLHPTVDDSGTPYCKNIEEEEKSDEYGCTPLEIDGGATYGQYWEKARENSTFWVLMDFSKPILDGKIDYLFIIDVVAGVFVLFVLLDYCLQMAIRLVKLAVYELIAPLPILARIMPNDQANKVFSNWTKATISTFLEVFIRIAILYFAILIITTVSISIDNLFSGGAWGSDSTTLPFVKSIAQALIVIGIVLFVKQAPNIIKEITGLDGGKYNVMQSAMRTAAGLGGAITTATRNWNAKEEDGSKKPMKRRLLSAAAGAGSAAWKSNMSSENVKDFKSMRQNAKSATEEAIKKRIARDNDRRVQLSFIEQENKRRVSEGNAPIKEGSIAAKRAYHAYMAKRNITEWAGAGVFDSVRVDRLAELASRSSKGFSGMEKFWKEKQGYKDADSTLKQLTPTINRLQREWKDHFNEYLSENSINYESLSKSEKLAIEQQASRSFERYNELVQGLRSIQSAKDTKEYIEHEEKGKKANKLAADARTWLTNIASFSDVAPEIEAMINRRFAGDSQEMIEKRKKFLDAYETYKNLGESEVFERFQRDLKTAIDDEAYKNASTFIDLYDEFKKEVDSLSADAQYQKQLREDTFGSKKEGK